MTTSAGRRIARWSADSVHLHVPGIHGQFDLTIEWCRRPARVYSVFHERRSARRLLSGVHQVARPRSDLDSTSARVRERLSGPTSRSRDERSGKDIYVSWNGHAGRRSVRRPVADYGATWTQQKLSDSKRYYYAYDARVLGRRHRRLLESSLRTPEPRTSTARSGTTPSSRATTRQRPGKTTSSRRFPSARRASPKAARPDFYVGQTSVVSDAPGHLVARLRRRRRPPCGPQRVYVCDVLRTAGGRGAPASRSSVAGEDATAAPARDLRRSARPHLVHADRRRRQPGRVERLVQEARSNGGRTWSSPVKTRRRLGRRDGNPRLSTRAGSDEIYGDYGEIARHERRQDVCDLGRGLQLLPAPAGRGSTCSAEPAVRGGQLRRKRSTRARAATTSPVAVVAVREDTGRGVRTRRRASALREPIELGQR